MFVYHASTMHELVDVRLEIQQVSFLTSVSARVAWSDVWVKLKARGKAPYK